ncbi:hypothetical protein GGS23DRAFT_548567 [Durotheca rogersii]|uniref:uncharacterized protein n=1 Tax=Durotheca rogersii TaxID=419775 RepID=UPI00221E50E5|nr:uncharacterized protein GGS23DRAFT_548567 [Durotheca rogersii]KAI5867484.1 hypothetical protein GGS23DRAFT_548567 [Durotheca rogersii]
MNNTTEPLTATTPIGPPSLLVLPHDILLSLPSYLGDIEDLVNLSSTCRALHACVERILPNTLLRLAVRSRALFQPWPYLLVCATARELGSWARASDANEAELASGLYRRGIHHLLGLALRHCGLTLARIRRLHRLRYTLISPVVDLVDRCVGYQWGSNPDFWDSGIDDAYAILADASDTFFQLAIYGELFGPEFDLLLPSSVSLTEPRSPPAKKLRVDTRLEFVKYCVPDFATQCYDSASNITLPDGTLDPRRAVINYPDGPYPQDQPPDKNNNLALAWLLKSKRWRPVWRRAREVAGAAPDFVSPTTPLRLRLGTGDWRQNLLEMVMQCQGLDGLGMAFLGKDAAEAEYEGEEDEGNGDDGDNEEEEDNDDDDDEGEDNDDEINDNQNEGQGLEVHEQHRPFAPTWTSVGREMEAEVDSWKPQIREWRDRIALLEQEPPTTRVGLWNTHDYPDLFMDLCICSSGFVVGT